MIITIIQGVRSLLLWRYDCDDFIIIIITHLPITNNGVQACNKLFQGNYILMAAAS